MAPDKAGHPALEPRDESNDPGYGEIGIQTQSLGFSMSQRRHDIGIPAYSGVISYLNLPK
jgi:hypothetical protein